MGGPWRLRPENRGEREEREEWEVQEVGCLYPEPVNPERKGSRAPFRRERERTSPQPGSSKESRDFEAANH